MNNINWLKVFKIKTKLFDIFIQQLQKQTKSGKYVLNFQNYLMLIGLITNDRDK